MNVTRQELSYENPQLIGPNPVLLNLDFESLWRTSATTFQGFKEISALAARPGIPHFFLGSLPFDGGYNLLSVFVVCIVCLATFCGLLSN